MTTTQRATPRELCELLGIRVTKAKRKPHEDAAQHEAGHDMVCLATGVDFAHVEVKRKDWNRPYLAGQLLFHEDAVARVVGPTRRVRLACALGGAIAEELTGGVHAFGAEVDLRLCFARVGVLNPGPWTPRADLRELHAAVWHTRNILSSCGRRDALGELAKALRRRGKLTYAQSASVAWRAGALVQMTPTFQPLVMDANWVALREEMARVDACCAEIGAWRASR